jgi:hypothetical protein
MYLSPDEWFYEPREIPTDFLLILQLDEFRKICKGTLCLTIGDHTWNYKFRTTRLAMVFLCSVL